MVRPTTRLDVSPALSTLRRSSAPARQHGILPGDEDRPAEPSVAVPRGASPTVIAEPTFEGLSDDDQFAIGVSRTVPSNANGDVGPSHYVQAVNRTYGVYDKAGNRLLGPLPGNALFAGFGGVCEATNDGEPIVLYDQLADRWVFSQSVRDAGTQCVAVSTTGDPTGSYFRYAFSVSTGINDAARLAVWPDAYYLTFNGFDADGVFTGVGAVALERDKMLQGLPARAVIIPVLSPAGADCETAGDCFFGIQPSHLEGLRAPPVGAPNALVMAFDDEVFGGTPGPTDAYKLWRFAVNWANPALSTLAGPVTIATSEFDSELCGFVPECIPQPVVPQRLDPLAQFTAYRLPYRNFGTHDALLVAHTVDAAPPAGDHAGIRWAELGTPATSPSVRQAGTHAPDADHRWIPSLAMDGSGHLALGYSVSGTVFPSLRYTGRLATDPAGTLTLPEVSLAVGGGAQVDDGIPLTEDGPRWGDYYSMSVDETDDCTFWFTGQYYQTTGSFDFHTRVGAFKFAECIPSPKATLGGTVTRAGSGAPVPGAIVQTTDGFLRATDGSGAYSMVVAPGTYDVSAFAPPCFGQARAGVVVANGPNPPLNFALVSASIPITAPVSIPVGATAQLAFVAPNPAGSYAWTIVDRADHDLSGLITAGGEGTSQILFRAAAPGTTLVLRVVETPTTGCAASSRRVQVDFLDVPPAHLFHAYVVNLAGNGVTAGCGAGIYCPAAPVTREQMAVFLLIARGIGGSPVTLEPCTTPPFGDVPCSSPFAPWIKALVDLGITVGCGGGNYCPTAPVTREQMAVFLLTALGGVTPAACTPSPFTDVSCASPFAPWIKELTGRGITAGCGGGRYCPTAPVTRGQMAVFLVKTFTLIFP